MITDILMSPVGRELDVGQIERQLASIPSTALDPHAVDRRIYMIASSDEDLEDAIAARVVHPKRFPYSVVLVEVDAARVSLSFRTQFCLEPARRFVQWLRASYEIRIMDEEFTDITDLCDAGLEYVFGPAAGNP